MLKLGYAELATLKQQEAAKLQYGIQIISQGFE